MYFAQTHFHGAAVKVEMSLGAYPFRSLFTFWLFNKFYLVLVFHTRHSPFLHHAATLALLATLQVPRPAYVYALLLSEFTQVTVPPVLFVSLIPPLISNLGSSQTSRKGCIPPLHWQYKLGHAYEFAEPPFSWAFTSNPLLSIQYYSLASEQGESELF